MKIYGKTLTEVFGLVPWAYKIVIVAGLAFICFSAVYVPYIYITFGQSETAPGPLNNPWSNVKGSFDPSVASDGKNVYMALSVVREDLPTDASAPAVHTEVRIARLRKGCREAEATNAAFPIRTETLMGPDGVTPVADGVWRAETPSLLYDPGDAGREWKLFTYRYFWTGDIPLARLYGVITYQHARDPQGPWSTEEWIFSAHQDAPPYPYSQIVRAHLNNADPSLRDNYFYARPSTVVIDGTIYMSLSAFIAGRPTPDSVILLASDDHARTWRFVSTLLTHDAVAAADRFRNIAGASLLARDGKVWLAAVLGDDSAGAAGTFLFPFENIATGALVKDADGGLQISMELPRMSVNPTTFGGGFATYTPDCPTGIFTSELSGLTGSFVIFITNRALGE